MLYVVLPRHLTLGIILGYHTGKETHQMRNDTRNQIDLFTSAKHNSVNVTFSYGSNGDNDRNYHFADMRHFLGHFGDILPLTDCVFHIHLEE